MKKIRLNVANLNATEILSREELKKVFGGNIGSGSSTGTIDCSKASPCSGTCSAEVNGQTLTGSCGVDKDFPGLGCRCIISKV